MTPPGRGASWSVQAVLAVTVLASTTVSACSLGPQSEPRLLDLPGRDQELPIGTEGGADISDLVAFTATIYLVADNNQLVPMAREITSIPGRDQQLDAVFRAVVDGPTDEEAARGLRSAVPPATIVLDSVTAGTTVTLDLSASFASIGGQAELLAVGQLVVTGTTFPGVQAMSLRLDGAPVDVPLPSGALTDQLLTLRQFSALLDP